MCDLSIKKSHIKISVLQFEQLSNSIIFEKCMNTDKGYKQYNSIYLKTPVFVLQTEEYQI